MCFFFNHKWITISQTTVKEPDGSSGSAADGMEQVSISYRLQRCPKCGTLRGTRKAIYDLWSQTIDIDFLPPCFKRTIDLVQKGLR